MNQNTIQQECHKSTEYSPIKEWKLQQSHHSIKLDDEDFRELQIKKDVVMMIVSNNKTSISRHSAINELVVIGIGGMSILGVQILVSNGIKTLLV